MNKLDVKSSKCTSRNLETSSTLQKIRLLKHISRLNSNNHSISVNPKQFGTIDHLKNAYYT